ncbi:MAG: mechanosensitive ion channel [Polyangiaceae bacterium]
MPLFDAPLAMLHPWLDELLAQAPTVESAVPKIAGILATLVGAAIFVRLLGKSSDRLESRLKQRGVPKGVNEAERNARIETALKVGVDVLRFGVWLFAIMSAFSQAGVSVQPLVAGASLIGAAVAFGAQAIVKDFVAGFFILIEGHFELGDHVTIGALTGTVEKMTLRVTVLRDTDGAVHVIPNGTIATVSNRTHEWSGALITFVIPFAVDIDKARACLTSIAKLVEARDGISDRLTTPMEVRGPLAWREKGTEWAIFAHTRPVVEDVTVLRAAIIEEATRQMKKDEIPFA